MLTAAQNTLASAVFNAVWACGHSITAERVTLHTDNKPAGLNARAQLRHRIETALAATRGRVLELSCVPDEAVQSLEAAVLGCPHRIDHLHIRLGYEPAAEGHNALNQLHRRIEAAVVTLTDGKDAAS